MKKVLLWLLFALVTIGAFFRGDAGIKLLKIQEQIKKEEGKIRAKNKSNLDRHVDDSKYINSL